METGAETNLAVGLATTNTSQAIRTLQTLDQKLELGALALEKGCQQRLTN